MKELKITSCIFCGNEAKLVRTEMSFKKGLAFVKVPQTHYECSQCKRTFLTNTQVMNNGTALTPHAVKLNQFTEGKGNTLTTPPENNAESK